MAQTTRQRKYETGSEVYSIVHYQKAKIVAVSWKPADKYWRGEWMYQLDKFPGIWLYETVLIPPSITEAKL